MNLASILPVEIIFKIIYYIDDNIKIILFTRSKFYHGVIMKYKGFKGIDLVDVFDKIDKLLGCNTKGNGKYSIIRNMNFEETTIEVQYNTSNLLLFIKSNIHKVKYSRNIDPPDNFFLSRMRRFYVCIYKKVL